MDDGTTYAWHALGGSDDLVDHVTYVGVPGLTSGLPVRELARAAVGVCSLAAAELLAARTGRTVPEVRVDEGAVAVGFTSERHLRVDGRPIPLFAPLSGFWEAADGWVRTHANYPHHRARLLVALGIPDSGDDAALAERLSGVVAERSATDVQEQVYAAGGLAVAVAPPGPLGEPLVTDPSDRRRHVAAGAHGHPPGGRDPGPRPHAGAGGPRRDPDPRPARGGRAAGGSTLAPGGRGHPHRHRLRQAVDPARARRRRRPDGARGPAAERRRRGHRLPARRPRPPRARRGRSARPPAGPSGRRARRVGLATTRGPAGAGSTAWSRPGAGSPTSPAGRTAARVSCPPRRSTTGRGT